MDAKEAVKVAKEYLNFLLHDEEVSNVGLDEIEYDDMRGVWLVTLGFSRPWNSVRNAFTTLAGEPAPKRVYRILSIDDRDGTVKSMRRQSALETDV